MKISAISGPSLSGKSQTSPGQAIEFINLGLKDYPECGTPLEVLEFHNLDRKSLAQRISGVEDIEERRKG